MSRFLLVLIAASVHLVAHPTLRADLDSWNDGPAKSSIIEFVHKVTTEGSPDFIPTQERIAVFDNDGTLWCEHPAYVQLLFAIDRVKAMAPDHREWKTQEPFKSVLAGDMNAVAASGEKGIAQIVAATHAGMTADEFRDVVKQWLRTARHPTTGRPYTEMVYQPMLEVLAYLRDNGFKTFIVSGGGVDFMRAFAEEVYAVPPEQIVGSRAHYEFQMRDAQPVLIKLPDVDLIDDGPGKPVGIQQQIGRRPVMAFGNSDGDRQMLEYTTIDNPHPAFALLVLHDDAKREYAYGPASGLPDSKIGTFSQSLADEAHQRGWIVVAMKDDWATIFPAPPDGH